MGQIGVLPAGQVIGAAFNHGEGALLGVHP
jgi:hypothetical protein